MLCGVINESEGSHEDVRGLAVGKEDAVDGELADSSSYLLELAANNDVDGFKKAVEGDFRKVDTAGTWYSRHSGTSQMVLQLRTPAMIAALYGSLDVLKYILNIYLTYGGDINQPWGTDECTPLHCAAAGGSVFAAETVKALVDFGANVNAVDAKGRRPADVIEISPRLGDVKAVLRDMLDESGPLLSAFASDIDNCFLPSSFDEIGLLAAVDHETVEYVSSSSTLSTASGGSAPSSLSTPSPASSPKSPDTVSTKIFGEGGEKSREYLIDPSLPDIKNSIYTTDEFRMFSFKVRPCSRAYSHDWTECPFVHPGENARRRDPRRFHYSCVPCPEFRKGVCRRGDACEYAHGVFECWLHPAQYRTRLCKDGTACARRVCFFAHTTEELRPLYVSTGSAVPSPRSSSLEMSTMSLPLAPGSPSAGFMFSGAMSVTPPMSPSSASASPLAGTWPQQTVPALHLPGGTMQASRLRAALNARDLYLEDMNETADYEGPLVSDFASLSCQSLSTQARLNAAVAASTTSTSRAAKYRSLGLTMAPTNLDELFASENFSSPRSLGNDTGLLSQLEAQIQCQKLAQMQSQLHYQTQAQVSSQMFPQASAQMQQHAPTLDSNLPASPLSQLGMRNRSPFSLGSLAHMGSEETDRLGIPLSSAVLAARAAFAQRDKRSYSSRDLGAGLALSDWGSPTGKPEWGMLGDDLSKLRKSASFGFRGSEEPDLSWVHKLVKEGSLEAEGVPASVVCDTDEAGNIQRDGGDLPVLGAWIDKLHSDQLVV